MTAPFVCISCAREIPAKSRHVILTPHSARARPAVSPQERQAAAGPMVCAKCRDLTGAHRRLFPDCAAVDYCDLYDHAQTLAADRTAAAAWLASHARLIPAGGAHDDTSTPTTDKETDHV